MDDKNKPASAARRAGRGFGRLLEKLLGRDGAGRLAESAAVLREEFEAGKRAAEPEAPRGITHRELPAREGPGQDLPARKVDPE